ncbi:SpoIIE family protein phosphatase [Streptomyces phaeoluteigriseus]|uniref:SpoIIE family protein phosphatase n=1 Tax=Streptomyces phaeoluteigriseus TaxID=114686 RepID=A0ABY4Z9A6_9ACTN|nr:SpoIIE family protein phosphatase [Streptomyces phaeoluteigriseus]USQ85521.1 SpoIIE family protein phosphatase [Streptomyces phaeoluteigriseus]
MGKLGRYVPASRRADRVPPEAGPPEAGPKARHRSAGRRLLSWRKPRSVASQVFLLQLVVVLLLIATAVVALVVQDRNRAIQEAGERSLVAAESFANAPGTAEAMESDDPTAALQPHAEAVRRKTGVDYVVALSPYGFRWTHPDPDQIGKHVSTSYSQALEGEPHQNTFDSSLGKAVDSTVAVFDERGTAVGLVTVGVTVDKVTSVVQHQLPVIFTAGGVALLLAAGGSALVSGRLRRQTQGLGPVEMTRMYEHHDAVLHAVREGVIILDGGGRLLLVNDEARRLLALPPEAEGRPVTELGLNPALAELLGSGRAATDKVFLAGDILLAVSVRPVGLQAGSVATLRDTTELRALAGRADVAGGRLQLLYEASTRIGTTLDMKRTAEELTEVAVPRFADFATVELVEPVLEGGEPTGASTEMRRIATAGIRDDVPLYPAGRRMHYAPGNPVAIGMTTGRPVLVADLATADGWRVQNPERAQKVIEFGIHSMISVPLQARGQLLGVVEFWRSEQAPFEQDDLSPAEELAARAAVCIDNARRYTREHTTAVTLQRSLLPGALPELSALEVGHRYLPAQAGVGGDWYDVIPLPGARVALVVGDVVGHGLHAAATMGRLRTAVHNFAALDLPPDELLAHLDDLITRIDQDAAAEGDTEAVTGATCLYAVYDPVSGHCVLARAGHPGPALVSPDGSVTFPDIPVAPPLGVGGGLPVETAVLRLAADSRLVLYTDGLVEARGRDIDTGLDMLREALAHTDGATPDDTCRAVLDAMLRTRSSDDVALLVARTRLLDPEQVEEWDVPDDPAAVSRIRAEATRRLESWGLGGTAFTTELILSELVTNAIRYGASPISLRLLRDRDSLICEVADGTSTSPHLRRAAFTDEGGRGLFLVAQMSRRWGTRYTDRGKIIWAEQALDAGAAGDLSGLLMADL